MSVKITSRYVIEEILHERFRKILLNTDIVKTLTKTFQPC